MKKKTARVLALLACVTTIFATPMTVLAEEGYTYNYDYFEEIQYSPDAYEVVGVYTSATLNLDKKLSKPEGLFVYGKSVYICDTGNNRIIELYREDQTNFSVKRIITEFSGHEVNTFSNPTDIAVDEDGNLYIADKGNARIVKLDKDLNFLLEFTKPLDATFDQSLDFMPSKLAMETCSPL